MANKSGIHINPKNKGKFNALKKRTGKTTEQLTHSKNPLTRKRAIFAQNARKWKHELGGYLDYLNDGGLLPEFGGDVGGSGWTVGRSDYGDLGGEGMNFGDAAGAVAQSAGQAGQIMNLIISAIRGVKDLKMQDLYNTASNELRQVDVRQMGNLNKTFIGLASGRKGRKQAELFNKGIMERQEDIDIGNRLSTLDQSPNYIPVAKQGGFTVYKGETHKGPTGGILTDEFGNPSGLSNQKAIALTEKEEVARYNPDTKNTYIYSESLGFAKPARDLVKRYKLDKGGTLQYLQYKNDPLLNVAVDRQFDNLQTAQEFAKGTKTSTKESLNLFKKGGNLTAAKAGEMLKDGTANGHKLTSKQKRYFGWVRGGKKDEGGPLGIKTTTTVTNRIPVPQTQLQARRAAIDLGLLSDTTNVTPQILAETFAAHPESNWNVRTGIPTQNELGYNYFNMIDMPHINPRSTFSANKNYYRSHPVQIEEDGGYVRKRKHPATYPFLPIPEAPMGAYVGELGGFLQDGGNLHKSYNQNLVKKDSKFQKWYSNNTLEGKNNIPYSDSLNYDYYSFYKNGNLTGSIKNHFPDTYKRPSHPTFSNESIYSTPENPGGQWKGETYIPANNNSLGYNMIPGGYTNTDWSWQNGIQGFGNDQYQIDFGLPNLTNRKYELGGYVPLFDSGGNLADIRKRPGGSNAGKYKGVHSFAGPSGGAPAGSYPINTLKRGRAALVYAHNAPNPSGIRAAVLRKYPQLKKAEYGGELPMYQTEGWLDKYYRPRPNPNPNSPFRQMYFRGYEPTGRPSILRSNEVIGMNIFPGSLTQQYNPFSNTDTFINPIEIPQGRVFHAPEELPKGTGKGVGRQRTLSERTAAGVYNAVGKIAGYNSPFATPGLQKTNNTYNPNTVTGSEETVGAPWLSPIGHVASGIGAYADYRAMLKARPESVRLPRAAVERINLAKQRLINQRQAEEAMAINVANTRALGVNPGSTFTQLASSNTGLRKVLGEQNMQSLLAEETTNAQMRQQANMLNAELAAQESLFNIQTRNAYNMLKARMNPLGSTARAAASYFADNAAYRQGYDTLQMLAPNAELYRKPGNRFWNWATGAGRNIKFKDKTL